MSSFTACTFENNEAGKPPPSLSHTRTLTLRFPSTMHVDFFRRSKKQYGGAVYTYGTASSFTACTFENNEAQEKAGALFLGSGSSSTFTLCTFQGNRALEGESNGHNVRVAGGSSSPASASIYACTFLDLQSDSNHGVTKYTGDDSDSSFTFYDNAPPLPPSPPPPPPPLTYSYATGSWSSCSATCGGGTETRSVTCKQSDGQSVSDSYCSDSKPSISQSCNTQECLTYSYSTGLWSSCSATCGGGTETRSVTCKQSDGQSVSLPPSPPSPPPQSPPSPPRSPPSSASSGGTDPAAAIGGAVVGVLAAIGAGYLIMRRCRAHGGLTNVSTAIDVESGGKEPENSVEQFNKAKSQFQKQYDNFGKIGDVTSFGTGVTSAIGTAGEGGGG
eukprot:CAMPEP_0119205734 /NCGR_PEP_ID=MMETSP1316-20130426/40033_1 /TAXON_ID=41880 /ORGANISM="Pycnococcus provasolii, Strain RCC2336" /LENGTH=387 /DNA_ID=CAMNT_0007202123 /DNA_START=371 /DNA_END=1530 /DNA_ORIENTATION=+